MGDDIGAQRGPKSVAAIQAEIKQLGRQVVKARFLGWRVPAIELPPDSVIDDAVSDIIRMAITSEVRPDG